jgi:hypothetical protein
MIPQPIHILSQMGVMAAFSVAKKITESDYRKLIAKGKRAGKSNAEIERSIKEKILGEIQDAIINQKIPGLLGPQDIAREVGMSEDIIANIPELNRLIAIIIHKLSGQKYDKMSLCYFINNMVNLLELQESDFEKFHQQNSKDDGGSDDKLEGV